MMAPERPPVIHAIFKFSKKSKLNPRLEILRFAIYGIALGGAYLLFKPEFHSLADDFACRWTAAVPSGSESGCTDPATSRMKGQRPLIQGGEPSTK